MFKLLLKQSVPNVISLLAISFYQIIDSIFVGRYLGEVGLAAFAVFSPVEYLAFTSLPVAFSIGAVALISPALGRDEIDRSNKILTQFLYWVMFYDIMIPVIFIPWLDKFLRILGCSEGETLRLARQYAFWMLIFGALVYSPNGGFLPLLRIENRAMTAMWVQVISSGLTLLFDCLLFPLFSEELELHAAAMSTLFALFITGCYTYMNYLGVFKNSVLRFVAKVKPNLKIIGTILAQAFPQFLNALPNQLGIILANKMISIYAANPQEANDLHATVGLFIRLQMLVLQPRQAIYLGFVSILGFNVGAKLWNRVLQLYRNAFWLIILFITFITCLIVSLANPLVRLFSKSGDFATQAANLVRLGMFGMPFGGPLMLCSGIFQMEHRPAIASVFQAIRLILTITAMLILPHVMSVRYICLGFTIGDVVSGIIGIVFFWSIYRRYKRTADEETHAGTVGHGANLLEQTETLQSLRTQEISVVKIVQATDSLTSEG